MTLDFFSMCWQQQNKRLTELGVETYEATGTIRCPRQRNSAPNRRPATGRVFRTAGGGDWATSGPSFRWLGGLSEGDYMR
jgi:hypothetical protein